MTELEQAELKSVFERDGALVLPSFFSAAEMAAVNRQLDAYAAEKPTERSGDFQNKTYTDVQSWAPIENGVDCFIELKNNPRLCAVTGSLLGPDYQEHQSLVMLTRKGKAQAWHQDTASERPGEFILNRLIYTRDTSRAAGGLVFVPGSRRQGQIPAGGPQDSIAGERLVEPRAGTLALVHSRCFHRVTPNETNELRFSINFRVRAVGVPADLTAVGVYRTGKWDFRTGKAA